MNPFLKSIVFRSCFLTLLILIAPLVNGYSQKRCATGEYMEKPGGGSDRETDMHFENWIHEHLPRKNSKQRNATIESSQYQVQVVIHVIHNGEPVGVGTNISDEQILSQLNVLNEDFKRLNEDAADTPEEFQPVAGSMDLNFILAKEDPEGNSSNGIIRVQGTRTSWVLEDNEELKSLTYWPAEYFLNIWVCNITDYIGYAQFPVSGLNGLSNASANRLTDGLIIRYSVFGTIDEGNFDLDINYNKGRTATHEMGHFFGLRHLWGDQVGCGGTDYVDDTPPQSDKTTGCPESPQQDCPADNPVNKMFQNFLDFTNDDCVNLFTAGQVERMKIVLENSPRRASLLTNPSASSSTTFPKIFSPNGDGINDHWKWPNGRDYVDCTLLIFNRYGKKVFEMTSYDGSWDGRSMSGQILEEEAYYYSVKCEGSEDLTGGVRIVR
jgi:gliding motility-associated-like protein